MPGVTGEIMRRTVWLFILALSIISCSNSQLSRNTAIPTPIPEKLATATAFDRNLTPTPTATPEAAVMQTSTPEAPPGPDINAIITQALSVMANVGTFHFIMDRQFISQQGADELTVQIPVRGKFNAPDSIQGTIIVSSKNHSLILDFIIIGEELYLREQNSDYWQAMDWQSNAAQVVRENAYLPLQQLSIDNFHEPVLVGEAILGGLPVYHLRSEFISPSEGVVNPAGKSIDFWIGKEDHLIYRVLSETTHGDGEEVALNSHSKIQVDYARFGEPVLIVAPQVDTSGGFRPTGSYPTLDQLNKAPADPESISPNEQIESSEPEAEEVAGGENTSDSTEERLD
jgi:hypothetical protein